MRRIDDRASIVTSPEDDVRAKRDIRAKLFGRDAPRFTSTIALVSICTVAGGALVALDHKATPPRTMVPIVIGSPTLNGTSISIPVDCRGRCGGANIRIVAHSGLDLRATLTVHADVPRTGTIQVPLPGKATKGLRSVLASEGAWVRIALTLDGSGAVAITDGPLSRS